MSAMLWTTGSCLLMTLIVVGCYSRSIHKNVLSYLNPIFNANRETIPGPPVSQRDGHIIDKFCLGRKRSAEWRGWGIYRLWAGLKSEVVITSPDDVRKFYSDSHQHTKAPACNAGWVFESILGKCLGMISGRQWRQSRRVFEHGLSFGDATRGNFLRLSAKALIEDLESRTLRHDGTFNAADTFTPFLFNLSAEILYGALSSEQKRELSLITTERAPIFGLILKGIKYRTEVLGWSAWRASRDLLALHKRWLGFNLEIYEQLSRTSKLPPFMLYWQSMLQGQVTQKEVLHTIDEMLFTNIDVFVHVLTWAVTLLATNPHEQARIRQEMDHCSVETYVNDEQSHLHHCLLESMRIRPFTVFSIPEASPEPKQLGGYTVPPYTNVVIDTLTLNVHNPFWGPDNEKFRPGRFETIAKKDIRYNFFAFGCGHRKCLGQHLAKHAIKYLLAELLSTFEVELVANHAAGDKGSSPEDIGGWVAIADVNLRLNKMDH